MPEPVFCPDCRAEYVWTATVCTECDVALVPEGRLGDGPATLEMPPISELVCIRAAALGWCTGLSDRLLEAGISHRIEAAEDDTADGSDRRPGATLPYGVYVLPADRERALAVDADHLRSQIPDLGEGQAPHAGEGEDCPACGSPVTPDDDECPDCGLALLAG